MDRLLFRRFILLFELVAFLIPTCLVAQESFGGVPRGSRLIRASSRVHRIMESASDAEAVLSWKSQQEGTSYIGKVISLDPASLEWQYDPATDIWQLEIEAMGAKALSLYYDSFHIPEGAKLYIYNPSLSSGRVLGAYTSTSLPQGNKGRYATEMLSGDHLTLEYQSSSDGEEPTVKPSAVGYIVHLPQNSSSLRYTDSYDFAGENNSGSCMVNVNCEEGRAWQNEKKGIAFIQTKVGEYIGVCSGTLLNNTAEDGAPYLITAAHCAIPEEGQKSSPEDLDQWVFYFHYEKEDCDNSSVATLNAVSLVGAELLAVSPLKGGTDGLFLRLKSEIPASYNLYLNGWSRTTSLPQSGVGLHHPSGDATKISTFTTPPKVEPWNEDSQPTAHINVAYQGTSHGHAVTEKGSSGSGLFNSEHLLVGTLTGGDASCTHLEGTNLYGRFSSHFESMKLSRWLAPGQSDLISLSGRYMGGENLAEIQDLLVWMTQKGLHVQWSKPLVPTEKVQSYLIYVDNKKLQEVASDAPFPLVLDFQEPGDHYLSVVTQYASGESRPMGAYFSNRMRHIEVPISDEHTDSSLTWIKPRLEQTWSFAEPAINTAELHRVGDISVVTYFYAGVWYGADQLRRAALAHSYITAIRYVPISSSVKSYIYIRQGDREYSQKITNPMSLDVLTTIQLKEPFVLNDREPIFVGLKFRGDTKTPFIAMTSQPRILGRSMMASLDGKNFFEYKTLSHSLAMETVVTASLSKGESQEVIRCAVPSTFPQIVGYRIMYGDKEVVTLMSSEEQCSYSPSLTDYPDRSKFRVFAVIDGQKPTALISQSHGETRPFLWSNQGRLHLAQAESITELALYDLMGKCLYRITPEQVSDISLSSGTYVVRIGLRDGSVLVQKITHRN